MRILHVINQMSGRAGAEVSLRDIALGTVGRFEQAIAVLRVEANRFDWLAEAGIQCFPPGSPLNTVWGRLRHVYRAIERFQPDVVHTALFDADVAGRVAAKVARVPAVTSLVNTPYTREALRDNAIPPIKLETVRLIDKVLSRHATTAFHAITETVAEAAVTSLGIPPSRITVVPRGRSRERLGWPSAERRRATRVALQLPPQAPVLINVARHEPQKGHTYLLEAFAEIRQRHPRAVLLLAGREGNRTPAIRRQIRDLGMTDCVRLLGVREDVADLLCAADVFVFPSLYEGLGGAVLEAMAMGVPIVASEAPALQEVLDAGRCGLLVPVANSAQLTAAIDDVLRNPSAARKRSQAAQDRFAATYELSICLEGMVRFYDSLRPEGAGTPP